ADWSWAAVAAQAAGTPQGQPDLVVRPHDVGEVAIAVRAAAQHGVPLVPWGAGSGVQGASVPVRGGLVLDLGALTRVREINEQAMTATVEAATVRIKPLPQARRFRTLSFPDLAAGLEAGRRMMLDGLRPPVMRLYDAAAVAHSLSRVVGVPLAGPTTVLVFEGRPELAAVEAALAVEHARACGGSELDESIAEEWWNHRFDFYHPPYYPTLPAMWGTIDVVA